VSDRFVKGRTGHLPQPQLVVRELDDKAEVWLKEATH
jgi:hypothetical protein